VSVVVVVEVGSEFADVHVAAVVIEVWTMDDVTVTMMSRRRLIR
jgi:hypothetical protein